MNGCQTAYLLNNQDQLAKQTKPLNKCPNQLYGFVILHDMSANVHIIPLN